METKPKPKEKRKPLWEKVCGERCH